MVGKLSLQEIAILAIIREISDSIISGDLDVISPDDDPQSGVSRIIYPGKLTARLGFCTWSV